MPCRKKWWLPYSLLFAHLNSILRLCCSVVSVIHCHGAILNHAYPSYFPLLIQPPCRHHRVGSSLRRATSPRWWWTQRQVRGPNRASLSLPSLAPTTRQRSKGVKAPATWAENHHLLRKEMRQWVSISAMFELLGFHFKKEYGRVIFCFYYANAKVMKRLHSIKLIGHTIYKFTIFKNTWED